MTVEEDYCDDVVNVSTTSTRDIYLTGDERYDVWTVKAAERPELLNVCSGNDGSTDENVDDETQSSLSELLLEQHHHHNENDCSNDNDDDDGDTPSMAAPVLPLTDGCDIPGWRRAKLGCDDSINLSSNRMMDDESVLLAAALGVGQGCTLLRRESQLPVLSEIFQSNWKRLQAKLLHLPHEDVSAGAGAGAAIPRLSYKDKENAVLHPWFERQNVPVLIEGCMDDWKAMGTYTWKALVDKFGDYEWRFSDTHAETMTLHTYDKYVHSIQGLTDDSPLAVYDSQFHTDERKSLLKDYQVPSCFDTDLFALVDHEHDSDDVSDSENDDDDNDNDDRPPYRWILMGPERSGTGLHVDPVGTHAWVSLVEGCKRWILFPPDTCRKTIGMEEPHQIPSALWFRDYYDKVCGESSSSYIPSAVHVLQRPGETVYVPAGWPHLVLNLQASVAITHNYATEYPSIDRLWQAVQEEAEPSFVHCFRQALEQHRPDLVAKISCSTSSNNNSSDTDAASESSPSTYNTSPTSSEPCASAGFFENLQRTAGRGNKQ